MRVQTFINSQPKVQPSNRPASPSPTPPANPNPAPPPNNSQDEVELSLPEKVGNFIGKAGRWLANTTEKIGLALAVAPTLGHLVVANEINRIEHHVFGKERLAAIDWLRIKTPHLYKNNAEGLLKATSRPVQSMGLSMDDLLTVEKHFYRVLAPVEDAAGIKGAPEFMRELAETPFRPPGTPHSAFVFLGEKRSDEAEMIMELWNGGTHPPPNPFDPGSEHHHMWSILEDINREGRFPIFLDLDDDATTYTGTEFVAKRTLSSMVERNNNFGDGFLDTGLYYSWLVTRMDSYYRDLDPWLGSHCRKLKGNIDNMKQWLTPDWLGGNGLGPFPDSNKVDKAFDLMKTYGQEVDEDTHSAVGLSNFADAAVALDRDMLTGVQSHWIKLLREIGHERRMEVLTPLERAWIHLNILPPDHPDFDRVSPANAPLLEVLEGPPARINRRPYDRSLAIGEVVDHSLDGLGINERRAYVDQVKNGIRAHTQELIDREVRLQAALPGKYYGLNISAILSGNFDVLEANRSLQNLKATLKDNTLERTLSQEVARHHQLMDWLVNADRRYGDVDLGLAADAPIFRDNPLAVSEFFEPVSDARAVTLLSKGPEAELAALKAADPQPVMGVSQVFEGGGGRGFAYVEAMEQVYDHLHAAKGIFRIDEFVGTSAGSHVAVLRAAGFEPSEMPAVLESVDFKQFNSDAVWLMGGVDPKVRGVNRNGIFSMQKMYQTFYQLLSEKLGIEGRPILFSDLPRSLKLVTVVLNTDLPPDDPLRKHIDDDGRFVMSSETTPNFDVIGAVLASSAVPAYFQAPQMEVARQHTDGNGDTVVRRYRMQFTDGGVVDNLSFSSAKVDSDNRALMVLPVHYATTDPATGERVALDTLNFDTSKLPIINDHNAQLYQKFGPQLSEVLTEAQKQGTERVVLAFNLSTEESMPLPALQGSSKAKTEAFFQLAEAQNFPTLDRSESARLVRDALKPESVLTKVGSRMFDLYVDGPNGEDDNLELHEGGSRMKIGSFEEENVLDLGRAAGAAAFSGSAAEYESRRFEKG